MGQTIPDLDVPTRVKLIRFLGRFQLDSVIHNPTGEISIINIFSGPPKTCCISFKSFFRAPKLTEHVVHVAILNAVDFWGDSSSIHRFTFPLVRLALLTYFQGPKKCVASHSNRLFSLPNLLNMWFMLLSQIILISGVILARFIDSQPDW